MEEEAEVTAVVLAKKPLPSPVSFSQMTATQPYSEGMPASMSVVKMTQQVRNYKKNIIVSKASKPPILFKYSQPQILFQLCDPMDSDDDEIPSGQRMPQEPSLKENKQATAQNLLKGMFANNACVKNNVINLTINM